MKMKLILNLLFAVMLLSACGQKDAQATHSATISVTDVKGNSVQLSQPAQRVVVLFEPLLDAVYMLQSEDALVGVSSKLYLNEDTFHQLSLIDDRVHNKTLATPGDEESLNIESVVALNPDLVVGYNIPESVVSSLQDMGIAVYIGRSETYADTEKEIQDLGKLLGKEKRSQELLDFAKEEFKKLQNNTKNTTPKKAYFSWANGRIFTTAGTGSMMGQCLEFAGVRNVVTSKIDVPNINPETLVSWNPDVIYMWNDSPELFYKHPQLQSVQAVKNRQVYNLLPMFFYNPHTLKALLTTLRIQNWAYQLKTEEEVKQMEQYYLQKLYGKEKGGKFHF